MTSPHDRHPDIRRRLGLRPIINVSGTMTALGASIVVPDAVRAVTEILPEFVEIGDLQRKASAVIARLTGGGIRRPEPLLEFFEKVVNLVRQHAPDAAIAFNNSPEDCADAALRWLR